jgi:FdhD protein
VSQPPGIVQVDVLRADANQATRTTDQVAAEAPLEVRLHGEPFSVIMRTPGADRDLAAGFLFTESVVLSLDDLARIEEGEAPNIVNVTLSDARAAIVPELLGQRRQVAMNSSCGMCGRRTLESLEVNAPALPFSWTVESDAILQLPGRLQGAQRAFAETGGLHAAGVFDISGRLELSAEDVGRHNAVDKLLGRFLMEGRLPLTNSLLFVSGRSSFEIVQKAFLGGLGLVAAVSAPSSLAIDLAQRCGITLIGFVRGDRFNIYTKPERVSGLGIGDWDLQSPIPNP